MSEILDPDPQTAIKEIARLTRSQARLNDWATELEERLATANARLFGAGLPGA